MFLNILITYVLKNLISTSKGKFILSKRIRKKKLLFQIVLKSIRKIRKIWMERIISVERNIFVR